MTHETIQFDNMKEKRRIRDHIEQGSQRKYSRLYAEARNIVGHNEQRVINEIVDRNRDLRDLGRCVSELSAEIERAEGLTTVLAEEKADFIYIPSINMHVSINPTYTIKGYGWHETHKALQSQGYSMLTPLQFLEFLKFVKTSDSGDAKQALKDLNFHCWSEWLDSRFVKEGRSDIYVLSEHKLKGNKLVAQKREKLNPETRKRREDKNRYSPNEENYISLDSWMNDPTSQGLSKENCGLGKVEEDICHMNPLEEGIVSYSAPTDANNYYDGENGKKVATFGSDSRWFWKFNMFVLNCDRHYDAGMDVGVRLAKHV